ncbi:MAG: NAD-dependent epimerase/dehydratase family protein [Myxococcota bacterium]|nr:NAD-dependent epimerase/dehydratase family protein [Myxococcota bacterium]MDW8361717.1 NAD-dependent epimerase/dehydratase family protein [Myxococcales bacterium]
MRIAVTGATGFLGGAYARRALREGDEVVALVRDPAGVEARELELAGARLVRGSLADPNEILEAARGAEVLVHAAGLSHRASAEALYATHVLGTENVVRAVRAAGVRRLVVLSCADVTLCDADRVHWAEDRAPVGRPVGEYARSRLLAEEIALAHGGPDLEVVAIRPAWPWGPGDRSRLPPLLAEALRGGIRLIGRGESLLATAYVDNVVDALVDATERAEAVGHAFYVQDAEVDEARVFFEQLSHAVGVPAPRSGWPLPVERLVAAWRERRRAPGLWVADVLQRGRSSCFDVGSAARRLGWSARTSRDEGMRALAEWTARCGGAEAIASRRPPPA